MRNIIKIAVAVLIMAAAVPGMAQEWEIRAVAGDELRGTMADTMFVYHHNNGSVFVSQANEAVLVTTNDGIFNIVGMDNHAMATIGLYDTTGALVEKLKFFSYGSQKDPASVVMKDYTMRMFNAKHPDNHQTTRMIDYLKHRDGAVRIILPRYASPDLDMTIPCMSSKWR